jgi:hypothetical protein
MSHGSAIFQVKDKCTSLVGSRNKLDHSEKKYGLPLWLCTIENKDLIILVFSSFPWHSMKLYKHSDSCSFWIIKIASLWISYLKADIIILNAHLKNILVNLLAFSIFLM